MFRSLTVKSVAVLISLQVLNGCAPMLGPVEVTHVNLAAGSDQSAKLKSSSPNTADTNPANPKSRLGTARATDRPANLQGPALIPMFHHLGTNKDPVFITEKLFINFLERLDKLGFRPVTAEDYLAGCPDLPPGASPVVMTFDDSNRDQLRILGDGSVDPHCFVGLWQTFAKTHPEFPVVGTFFVLPETFFGQPELFNKKLSILRSLGCELANHTISHPFLSKKKDGRVEWEIAKADVWLTQHGERHNAPLALPFGVSPKNKMLLRGFTYMDKEFHGQNFAPSGIFRVGAGPSKLPNQPGFNRYSIPRILAGKGELTFDYWLKRVESGKLHPYVAP